MYAYASKKLKNMLRVSCTSSVGRSITSTQQEESTIQKLCYNDFRDKTVKAELLHGRESGQSFVDLPAKPCSSLMLSLACCSFICCKTGTGNEQSTYSQMRCAFDLDLQCVQQKRWIGRDCNSHQCRMVSQQ